MIVNSPSVSTRIAPNSFIQAQLDFSTKPYKRITSSSSCVAQRLVFKLKAVLGFVLRYVESFSHFELDSATSRMFDISPYNFFPGLIT